MTLLSRSLTVNVAFSTLSGLILIFAHKEIGAIISDSIDARYLLATGVLLLAFAAQIILTLKYKSESALFINTIILSDLGWVLGSIIGLVIFSDYMTLTGIVMVIAVAIVVGTLSFFQNKGFKLSQRH